MPNTHRITSGAERRCSWSRRIVLRHGATYYWRVRGRSTDGVWGEWSPTWSFVAAGPGMPRDLKITYDQATGDTILSWSPPAEGLPADHYEIYASSEHGFFAVACGMRKQRTRSGDPKVKTLVGVTRETRWDAFARPEMFYRVTAVDTQATAASRRRLRSPFAGLLPVETAPGQVGLQYRFKAACPPAIRPLCPVAEERHDIDGADTPKFTLPDLPGVGWLRIDHRR